MTYKQVADMIKGLNIPYTYNLFPNNIAPEPPYIVFNYPRRNDFGADDENYVGIEILNIELYTATKNFTLENTVETTLTTNGFYFTKNEEYIAKEKMFQISYVMQFIID